MPAVCHTCRSKTCINSIPGIVDVCQYGVAYYNVNGQWDSFVKNSTLVPLRHLSRNLRHEINRVIALIQTQANIINPMMTKVSLDFDNPADRIYACTLMIDYFIKMIAGVHEFHPSRLELQKTQYNLEELVKKLYNTYGLIKNISRQRNLSLELDGCEQVNIGFLPGLLESVIAAIIDNAWKYSVDDSTLKVTVENIEKNLVNVSFSNKSFILPDDLQIFNLGVKAKEDGEGFGYGLYWASILMDHYNHNKFYDKDRKHMSEIEHTQIPIDDKLATHIFKIRNIATI
jgi:K+-sensing histidine kinase KdpD